MIARLLPHPLLALTIFLVWVAITNAGSAGLLLLGALLAVVLPLITRSFWPEAPRLARPGLALRFLGVFSADIVLANLRVARQVIGPLHRLSPALVEIPLDLRDPFVATLLASVVSLTPGTVAIDVDQQRWTLLVHALDSPDQAALIAEIKTRYEAPLKEIFGC